ncbi:hypothetical protein C8R43DRAFT_1000275 [Mycena crocata]|nr:hypothetical protein C8R43DRAFT_1000275 [Mycena crocata]
MLDTVDVAFPAVCPMSSTSSIPPGVTFIALITPSLNLLIIGTVWAAALVPLLLVLLFFSTPDIRRQPIFLMNLFAVIMGIVIGAVNLRIYVQDILSPPGQGFSPRLLLAYLGMILFLPLFLDCILAFRLYVVYPPRSTSKVQLAIIFIPIAVFKFVRTTNLIIFMVKFAAVLLVPDSKSAVGNFQVLWDHAPWTKIEWILQVFDNCYASGFFLWRLWLGRRTQKTSGMVRSTTSIRSGGDMLKRLFYLALSSFVFPCMFSIAQIILTFHNRDFFLGAYIFVTNLYIEIIGVLLATIWASKTRSEKTEGGKLSTQLSSMAYRVGNHGIRVKTATTKDTITNPGNSSFSRGDVELEEFSAGTRPDEEPSTKARAFGHDVDSV